jgi:signal transduction histidine kinase
MNKITLIILLLLTSFITQAQSSKMDSLKNRLSKLFPTGKSYTDDTLRVKILCEMGDSSPRLDSSFKYFEESIRVADDVSWKYGQAKALNSYSNRLYKNSDFSKSSKIAFKALDIAEKNNYKSQIALACRNIAYTYTVYNQLKEALIFYNRAIIIYQSLKDKDGVLNCYHNINKSYSNIAQFDNARKYCLYILKINHDPKIERYDAYAYHSLGVDYETTGNLELALKNLSKALNIYQKLGQDYNDPAAAGYIELAHICNLQKKYTDAIRFSNKASELNGDKRYLYTADIYKILYRTYKAMGDETRALEYHEKYLIKLDSANQESINQKINALRVDYDNQKLTDDLDGERFQQKILWGGLSLFLLIGGVLFYSNRILKNKNTQIENQRNEILAIKSDLEYLNESLEIKVTERTSELREANETLIQKNQEIIEALFKGQTIERKRVASELHDNLGGTLSAIKWRLEGMNDAEMSTKEKKIYDGLLEMLQGAYAEVRLISHNMLPDELEKNGLEKSIRKLVNEINQGNRIEILFSFKIDEKSLSNQLKLELYSICLELLNNVLKHAQAKEVVIHFYQREDKLTLQVMDDGIGISLDPKGNGMGMKNIQTRVESLKGILKITPQEPTGTSVIIAINN